MQIHKESQTVNTDLHELKEGMKVDPDTFASIALPDVSEFPFPPILISFWQALLASVSPESERFPKLAVGIPRGHAKSTMVKLFALFCILFTKKQFILITCAKESLAANLISDIVDMLDSPNIRAIFGDWRVSLQTDKSELKIFEFCGRPIILAAAGSGSSIRGINVKNARPDIMIFDDAQTKTCAESDVESRNFITWFSATQKAKSPKSCTFIYIGNMYKQLVLERDADNNPLVYGCMLHNLSLMSEWKSFISGAILLDGSVLWEELHPKEELMKDLAADMKLGAGAEWFAEVQNDPSFVPKLTLDPDKIARRSRHERQEFNEIPHTRYLVIDPSLGKKKSDDLAIGMFEVTDQTPIFAKLWIEKLSQPLLVKFAIDLAIENNIPLITSEDYGMQGALLQWFSFWANEMKLEGIEFAGINRGRMSKTSAILDYLKLLNGGRQVLDDEVFSQVVDQGQLFDPRRTDNTDDILDVGYYGERVWATEELREVAQIPLLASSSYSDEEPGELIIPTGNYVN